MIEDRWKPPTVLLTVDLVILTLRAGGLQMLLVERGTEPHRGSMALPGGFLEHSSEGIEAAARRELAEEAGLDDEALHLEELGVYGDPGRDPRGRVVSVAYLAIAPGLPEPVAGTDAARARWMPADDILSGRVELAFDHRRIVDDAIERARRKLEYSALATAFCGPVFTISELQRVYEAVWGVQLDPRNFYRKVQGTKGFVVSVGEARKTDNGRPARLFRAGSRTVLYPPMVRTRGPAEGRGDQMSGDLVVVLTALDLEYSAVRRRLNGVKEKWHKGTRFEVGRFAGGCPVALALVNKGNHSAAVLADRAIEVFDPAAVFFVGVAGALRSSLNLGDIAVATHVYAYHGATSEDDGAKARPRVWEADHRADQMARHVARSDGWLRLREAGIDADRPSVHFGPIAAGEVVLNSRTSTHAQWMDEHYNDAIAIEMESAGVAQAGHLNDNVPVVVVRGISDRADGTKETTDRAQWQPKAVASAAAFAEALADEFVRHVHKNRREEAKAVAKVERKGPSAVNQKVSRSNEVIQVGIIHGNANIGGMSHRQAPTLSATDQLGNLGERLTQARVFGELDPETVAAAEAELAVAADALVGRSPNAAPMMALKRLRGLVEDVPDLASRVAAVISTVSGRS